MNLKKDLAIVGGLFLLVVVLLVFGRGFTTTTFIGTGQEATGSPQASINPAAPNVKTLLTINTLNIYVDVSRNREERQKGLSGRDQLPLNEGMLFVFETSSNWAIWMKDMKFPIDIIWIGEDKKIVDIAQNALPEPGKDDRELKIYRPKGPAKYILEINAGLSKLHNLQVGDVVSFEIQ